MAIQVIGPSGTTANVDANQQALRTTPRPIDVGTLGSYCLAAESGVIAAAAVTANSIFFSFRWTDATRLCLVRKVSIAVANAGTAFAAATLPSNIYMTVARSFTASDTGGTAISLAGNNNKRRTSFGTSLVGDARIASVSMVVAGTRNLDGNPLCMAGPFSTNTTVAAVFLNKSVLFGPDSSAEWPLILAQNEGFVLVNSANAFAGTGTTKFYVEVEWVEVSAF